MYESKRICCICRDNTKSIIIHHIEEWHETHNHNEDNLVVLCLQHHDEAHAKKSLILNLTPKEIKKAKERWCEEVKSSGTKAILGLITTQSRWDYINTQRLFELFIDSKIEYQNIQSYPKLRKLNIIDENSIPTSREDW